MVGLTGRREPMGDGEDGDGRRQRRDRLADGPLALGVERAGRLVEHEQARSAEEGAREREPLALSTRQKGPAVADERIEPGYHGSSVRACTCDLRARAPLSRAASPVRCSIASTCRSRCRRSTFSSSPTSARASRPRVVRERVMAARERSGDAWAARVCTPTRRWARATSRAGVASTPKSLHHLRPSGRAARHERARRPSPAQGRAHHRRPDGRERDRPQSICSARSTSARSTRRCCDMIDPPRCIDCFAAHRELVDSAPSAGAPSWSAARRARPTSCAWAPPASRSPPSRRWPRATSARRSAAGASASWASGRSAARPISALRAGRIGTRDYDETLRRRRPCAARVRRDELLRLRRRLRRSR